MNFHGEKGQKKTFTMKLHLWLLFGIDTDFTNEENISKR
jgi:hypothetical protein